LGRRSVPQTGQRTAVSESRVPHVGQTCVFCDGLSGFIRAKIIPHPIFCSVRGLAPHRAIIYIKLIASPSARGSLPPIKTPFSVSRRII
jgi:hypothetical protein